MADRSLKVKAKCAVNGVNRRDVVVNMPVFAGGCCGGVGVPGFLGNQRLSLRRAVGGGD
jgi:hypothetical protein